MTGAEASARLLIGLDVDGTLILEDGTPSPGIVEAIAGLRAAGHVVMLATGRSWEATRQVQGSLGIEADHVVCSNGAVVMRRLEDGEYERWHVETFDASAVLGLLREHLPDARYMVERADGARLYTEQLDDWTLDRAQHVGFDELSAEPVTRVVVVSPDHDEADFVELAARVGLNEVSYAVGWTAWLDIAPIGVDKSAGLERVRETLGIERDDVVVIGDGRNDIEMFQWALAGGGRAAAMGQAPDEVRSVAGETTDDVEHGGAAAVLRSL